MEKLDFYELAKEKVSEDFAKGLLKMIEDEISKKYADKEKHLVSKEDIVKVEAKIETSISKLETSLANKIYATGVFQFVALLSSLIALLKLFDLK